MSRTLTVLLVGIVIGLLIAPDKGTATRKKLSGLFDGLTGDDDEDRDPMEENTFPSGRENRDARNDQAF